MIDRRERILSIINYLQTMLEKDRRREKVEIASCDYGIPDEFPSSGIEWQDFGYDSTWGGSDKHFLFRSSVKCRGEEEISIILETDSKVRWSTDNPQILVYLDGRLYGTMDVNHNVLKISEKERSKADIGLGFYAYSNSSGMTNFFHLSSAVPVPQVLDLYFDMKCVFEAADLLEHDDLERVKAFRALEDAIDILDTRTPALLYASSEKAREVIREYMSRRTKSDVTLWSVGSTHIDVAWKWPVRQTREKAVRSVLTALRLMEKYPDYHFLLTQPQLYEFVRESRPDLFAEIKKRIREGRWEAEGGMWLESDCNLASGESLVRQLLYGKRYFSEVLGAPESEILWLPDAFGFNGNLPQIMKKAGIKYFMTTKISWSDTHIFPYDVFSWRGIDGSEILSYFISTRDYGSDGRHPDYHTTYNGEQNASQIMGTWKRFQDKDITEDVLTCFGYGDGGGGPTAEMIESTERFSHSVARCPRTVMASARSFFSHLEMNLRKKLPRWTGELYFEYHRGVMTSISEEKKWNRRIEGLVHDAEAVSVMAGLHEEKVLGSVWKTILLNQFHDILPGSAIDEVYETAFREYAEASEACNDVISSSIGSLLKGGRKPVAVNTSSHRRTALITLDEEYPDAELSYDGKYLLLAKDVPSYGIGTVSAASDARSAVIKGQPYSFETPYYRIEIDGNGTFSSIFDKNSNREVIISGNSGNRIISYEDRPLRFDNWNTEEYYREKGYQWELSGAPEIVENSSLRGVVEVKFRSLSSELVQHIAFYRHTPRIDFISSLDWDGDHLLVKAEFPVDVHSYTADYEIQFGAITRSAMTNTDWDRAAFEVPALRWSDISEPGYGVSLLTDSKYGYSVRDGVMTVSLLKSGTSPAENADRGHHEFTYSLFPHKGDWREGGTVLEAEEINKPLYCGFADEDYEFSFAESNKDNVIIDTIKHSEDGKGIVIRAYEAYGTRTEATLSFHEKHRFLETDLLERNGKNAGEGYSVTRVFKPYEIVTFYLERL